MKYREYKQIIRELKYDRKTANEFRRQFRRFIFNMSHSDEFNQNPDKYTKGKNRTPLPPRDADVIGKIGFMISAPLAAGAVANSAAGGKTWLSVLMLFLSFGLAWDALPKRPFANYKFKIHMLRELHAAQFECRCLESANDSWAEIQQITKNIGNADFDEETALAQIHKHINRHARMLLAMASDESDRRFAADMLATAENITNIVETPEQFDEYLDDFAAIQQYCETRRNRLHAIVTAVGKCL